MQKKDFSFTLPDSLIAQQPCDKRTDSRLLHLTRATGQLEDAQFTDILDLIRPGDLLVMNNTRVIPARLFGKKETGGAVEVLIERIMGENRAMAFVRASKSPKLDGILSFPGGVTAKVVGRDEGLFELEFSGESNLLSTLEELGEIPLPPYMHRDATDYDKNRYQTVFAQHPGAVAAPTAGLHFDEEILGKIKDKGVDFSYVTLHVGAGTFQPIRVDNIIEHKMHRERIDVSPETCAKINQTRKNGGRIVAVGTTVVRSLESAARAGLSESGELRPFNGDTDIFIYPGYKFNIVNALITNFHLPESTLLMLVSAFASSEQIKDAYQHAIESKYRFYSYGDAMFIE
ncbi:MAG: tRNA preQ1(34) S-adenosylmethionine ribosyltransferase-isomerase QueA [Gammaproteobacteria bacterium]|nr:tRNA preQ1(34) S-adenosylmethionine ribosyltransferase-isomerase QueA [Gammaproteobacteria bacterium]